MVVTRAAANTKRRKTSRKECLNEADRISSLSDDILLTILEKLPVKDSVRTTKLAQRWENVWKSMSSIHIDSSVEKGEEKYAAMFMRSFMRHNPIEKLKCFSVFLKFKNERIGQYKKWMEFAISKKVENLQMEMDISKYKWQHTPYPNIFVPVDFFNCSSLIQVTLAFWYLSPLPSFQLQSLRKLLLDRCQISENGIERITSNCLLLEHLVLSSCNRSTNLKITVASHSKLSALIVDDRDPLVTRKSTETSIETSINAPNVTSLVIYGNMSLMRKYSLFNVPNIVEGRFKFVHINLVYLVESDQDEDLLRMDIAEILEKFVRAKILRLCSQCILAAVQMRETDLEFNLARLELETHLDLADFTGILVLLRACRQLEHLVFNIRKFQYGHVDSYVEDDDSIKDMELHPLERLTYVEFKKMKGCYQMWDEGKFQMSMFFIDCVIGNKLVKLLKPPYAAAVEKIVFTTRLTQFVSKPVPK